MSINPCEAGENNSIEKRVKLESLKISYEINLKKIFKPMQIEKDKQVLPNKEKVAKSTVSMQLVGTMIFGKGKTAWIKIGGNRVHELRLGQIIPGSGMRVSQIYPDFIEIVNLQQCQLQTPCNSSQILNIHSTLF